MLSVVEPREPAPYYALSLRQPWAEIVLSHGKRIENRRWCTGYRGRVLLHASRGMTGEEYQAGRDAVHELCGWGADLGPSANLQRGGFVGTARIVGVIPPRPSVEAIARIGDVERWYAGHGFRGEWRWHFPEQYGFILEDVEPRPFVPSRGTLGIYPVHANPWPEARP